jgi:hypothetical protein
MNLGDKIHVILEVTGEVVGRTFEQNPKIDLKLPWGMLNGLPISVLTHAESVEEDTVKEDTPEEAVPANVTRIRPLSQKRKGRARATG